MSRQPRRSLFDHALFAGFLALILWVPIPLGSNRPWSWAVLELWVFVLVLGWLAAYVMGRVHTTAALRGAWPALLCCALWLAYVWLQLLPLPAEWLNVLSPHAARWHADGAWPAQNLAAPLTVDRYATLDGALKSAAYVGFFALSLALFDRHERIAATGYTLVVSGLLQALYGGITALTGAPGEVASGSFVNRNHFAGYLELCLSAGLGLLVGSLTGQSAHTWKQFLRDIAAWILSPRMLLRLALVIMVIALILSRSRMGNSAFFISMLVTGVIALLLSRNATRSTVVLITSLVVIDIVLVGAYFGVEKVVDRIEQTQMQEERRESTQALGIWQDYPVFGSGLGSFRVVFPKYRGADLGEPYTHAHNDYIEFASETGAIGIGLLGLLVLMSFGAALRAQFVRHNPLMRGLSFGAMMGIISLMIHSGVDFNLQIPANALTFMLLLAFAWVSLHHRQP